MTTKQYTILIQMGSDGRIPAGSLGYVSDLETATISVRQDRLRMLSRYVPDLVAMFIESAV